ncbi:MAG: hypothetical protein U0800_18030 [Isosphaeraceae bacterium]
MDFEPATTTSAATKEPGKRRFRISLGTAMIAIVIVALLLMAARRFVLGGGDFFGGDSVLVEFTNQSSTSIELVTIVHKGGSFHARGVRPGQTIRRRVWPAQVKRLGDPYYCNFAVETSGHGGPRSFGGGSYFHPSLGPPLIGFTLLDGANGSISTYVETGTYRLAPDYIFALQQWMDH